MVLDFIDSAMMTTLLCFPSATNRRLTTVATATATATTTCDILTLTLTVDS